MTGVALHSFKFELGLGLKTTLVFTWVFALLKAVIRSWAGLSHHMG